MKKVKEHQVWKNKTTKKKVIVSIINIDKITREVDSYDFISDRPHGEGDYSYICGFDYCRCIQ